MHALNNNQKSFNLPAYINIPFFLYQDSRLEKSALLIAAFFYSLHTAGQKMTASKDYLCQLSGISKSQYFCILNQLEEIGYIKRSGFTNRKKTIWVYCPKSEIIVDESDASPVHRTSVENLHISPVNNSTLVRSTGLNLSGLPDIDTKEDIKVIKKLTTENQNPVSSSFFSVKLKNEILELKLERDPRSDEEFLEAAQKHVEEAANAKQYHLAQRKRGVVNLLKGLYADNVLFNLQEPKTKAANQEEVTAPLEETEEERKNRIYIQYEFEKERFDSTYKSKVLEIERKMERDNPGYKSRWLAMDSRGDKYANAG